MMKDETPVEAHWRFCARYLELGSVADVHERIRETLALFEEWKGVFARLMAAAETNDAEVWHALGDACDLARGTERDREAARRWYQRAADAGHAKAMVRLAMMHRKEAQDGYAVALALLKEAAKLGDASAMVFLGFSYREGYGVSPDPDEAARWFTRAAEAGDKHALVYVGKVWRDQGKPEQAVASFLQAAEAGQYESYVELAMLYDVEGSPVYDPVEAVKWYRVVADGSSSSKGRALLALARHSISGQGMPCDLAAARRWLEAVILNMPEKSSWHKEAKQMLAGLEGGLL